MFIASVSLTQGAAGAGTEGELVIASRLRLFGVALLLVLTAGTVVASSRPGLSGRPLQVVSTPAVPLETEALYAKELESRLSTASAEARSLVDLAERRSRNLLEIRAAQRRMEDKLDAVDAFASENPPPAPLASALDSYRNGARAIRTAMDEAQAGFFRLDWERVASAYDRLATGADRLRDAHEQLVLAQAAVPSTAPAG